METAASPQRLREGTGGAVFPFPQDAIEAVALQQLRHRLVVDGHEQPGRVYLKTNPTNVLCEPPTAQICFRDFVKEQTMQTPQPEPLHPGAGFHW